MQDQIDIIRMAIATNASPESRAAGAAVCRRILAELEPAPAQAAEAALAPPAPVISPDAIPQLVAMVKQMDVNQLLDVAIERLRELNATRSGSTLEEPVSTLRIPLVPIPARPNPAR